MVARLIVVMSSALVMFAADQQEEAIQRVHAASEVLQQIMAAPDQGIPEWVLERANCAVIVPGMKQGGFVFGARYGKGVALCRHPGGGWSGPSTVRIEGGSFGLQIGGGEVDVVMFVMNEEGKERLLRSKFTIGGETAAMAGPVGRSAEAETDAYMRAKILSYSRSRGVFAGAVIEGATLRPDDDDNQLLYGKAVSHTDILMGKTPAPASAGSLVSLLGRYSFRER